MLIFIVDNVVKLTRRLFLGLPERRRDDLSFVTTIYDDSQVWYRGSLANELCTMHRICSLPFTSLYRIAPS